jgi:hypothetical protein
MLSREFYRSLCPFNITHVLHDDQIGLSSLVTRTRRTNNFTPTNKSRRDIQLLLYVTKCKNRVNDFALTLKKKYKLKYVTYEINAKEDMCDTQIDKEHIYSVLSCNNSGQAMG